MEKYSLGLGLTSKCNMACSFCYSKFRRKNDDIDIDKWITFIKNNSDFIADINFGTGENPLLKEWFYFIDYLNKEHKHINLAVTTNGSLYYMINKNENFKKITINSISEIDVSLDFCDEIKHNSFRGSSRAYSWALNTLKFCQDNKIQSTIVMLGINETLEKENLEGIFEIAKKYGSYVRINLYRPVDKNCDLEPPLFKNIIKAIEYMSKKQKIISLSDPLFSSILTTKPKKDPSAWKSLRILQNGEIYPSTYLINKKFLLGNIQEEIILPELTNHPIIKKIMLNKLPLKCETCSVKKTCKGGTIDRRFIWYGDLSKRDPYCPKKNNSRIPKNKYVPDDFGFDSIHDGYLPTLFFRPR